MSTSWPNFGPFLIKVQSKGIVKARHFPSERSRLLAKGEREKKHGTRLVRFPPSAPIFLFHDFLFLFLNMLLGGGGVPTDDANAAATSFASYDQIARTPYSPDTISAWTPIRPSGSMLHHAQR